METAIVTIGVLGAAGLALLGVLSGHILGRVKHLEDDLEEEQTYNRELWWYCRRLIDDYYKWRRSDAPDPHPLPNRKGDKP